MVSVPVRRLSHGEGLDLPHYVSPGSAGMDIAAAVLSPVIIRSLEIKLIPSGFCLAIPEGFEVQIRPRSGLAVKHGVTVVNAPGTVDSDYRGEVKVGLINFGLNDWIVERGQRIAQMVLSKVWKLQWQESSELPGTIRGEGGFGHSGI